MSMETSNYQCALEVADPIRNVGDWLEELVKELRTIRRTFAAHALAQHGQKQWMDALLAIAEENGGLDLAGLFGPKGGSA